MQNAFDEPVILNDVLFACFIIERISRRIHQSNLYVVSNINKGGITFLLEFATTLHCQDFDQTCDEMINEYHLKKGNVSKPERPSDLQIGNVYSDLIWAVKQDDLAQSIIDVYRNPICKILDDYTTQAYSEPISALVKTYYNQQT